MTSTLEDLRKALETWPIRRTFESDPQWIKALSVWFINFEKLFSAFQEQTLAKERSLRKELEKFPYLKCQKVRFEGADDYCSNEECENYRSCNWFWRTFKKELLEASSKSEDCPKLIKDGFRCGRFPSMKCVKVINTKGCTWQREVSK